MMRLLVSWWQSLSLLKPSQIGRLFFIAGQNSGKLYRLFWTYGWAFIALWLVAAYAYYEAGFFQEIWQLRFAGAFFRSVFLLSLLFLCVLARSSMGKKDMAYIKEKAFIIFLLPVFLVIPPFLALVSLPLAFFFLDTRGKIEDFIPSCGNAGLMVLHNLPIFIILIVGCFFIMPLIVMSRIGQMVAFLALPFIVALLMVIYQKRLYDDFSIYMIK